eukprot:6891606-Prymnesium_polylepis.2
MPRILGAGRLCDVGGGLAARSLPAQHPAEKHVRRGDCGSRLLGLRLRILLRRGRQLHRPLALLLD